MEMSVDNNANNGLLTKIWGPPAWMTMQCFAFGYPINPTLEQKKNYRLFYESIAHTLPCKFCRDSYSQFILESDTLLSDKVFETRDTLTKWIYDIHEKVNAKLGVTYGLTYEDFVKKHESFRAKCIKDKVINGCNMPLRDRTNAFKMAYNKDCPLIDLDLAKKIIPYAIERGFSEKDFNFIKLYETIYKKKVNLYGENLCDVWFERNKICEETTRYMRTHNIKPLEEFGEYTGLPTISELKLLLNLTSTLTKEDLLNVINVVSITKNKKIKRYYIKKYN